MHKLVLILDDDLHAVIAARARAQFRSVEDQVVHELERPQRAGGVPLAELLTRQAAEFRAIAVALGSGQRKAPS